jgi:outer membrane lipoprotein-sorting protein
MKRRARLSFVAICALAAAWLAVAPVVGAQEAALPEARTIVARHVEAVGGAAAFKAIKSVRAKGTFELTAQGLTGAMDVVSARPGKMRVTVEIPGVGRIESCYDGKIGWEIDPAQGPVLLTGRRLSEMADDAWFDSTLHEPDFVRSMTTVGREEFDRRPAYKVKVVFVSGNEQHEFFDAETGFQLGYEASRVTPMGPVPITAVMRDYKKFGAVQQPATLLQRTLGLEQIVRLETVEFNTVPDNAFEPPPAIKALIR